MPGTSYTFDQLRLGLYRMFPTGDRPSLSFENGHYETVPPVDHVALEIATAAALAEYAAGEGRRNILRQIELIESAITPRRFREALLGTDGGWLAARNQEIATLRSQL